MRVMCINNDRCSAALTVGKEYETEEDEESPGLALMASMGHCMIVKDDMGQRSQYQLSRFKPVDNSAE